jgi:hypothetical protein
MKEVIEDNLFTMNDSGSCEIPQDTIDTKPGLEIKIVVDGLPQENYMKTWIVENIHYIKLDDSDAYGVDLINNPYMFINKNLKLIKKGNTNGRLTYR